MSQPVINIRDQLLERTGVSAENVPPFSRVALFPSQNLSFCSEGEGSTTASEVKVHHYEPVISLFYPVTRKFINETNGTFLRVQKLAAQISGADLRMELLKYSQQYRSIVRTYMDELRIEAEKSVGQEKKTYTSLVKIFCNAESLWHFCEILYINAVPGDAVLSLLLDWIQSSFFKFARKASEIITTDTGNSDEARGAESIPEYWDTITGLVLQGNLKAARTLLHLHSAFQTSAFQNADYIMRTMPEFNAYVIQSVTEFNLRWEAWQDSLKQKLISGVFSSRRELELIMKVMVGQPETFLEVKHLCDTWYCYMAAILLYTEPTVKMFDLSYHADRCIQVYHATNRMKDMDIILLSLMESNLKKAINYMLRFSDHYWFATHLTDLLYHCGVLDREQAKVPETLRVRLLLDYGRLLMTHHSLWKVGVDYLDYCNEEGRACLELMLSQLPLVNENRAFKIIQVAQERNMDDIVTSICKKMAMDSYREHRLGNALSWSLSSQDSSFTTFIADKLMETYYSEGVFRFVDALDQLGSSMLVSDRLAFLGKYFEFHQMYGSGEFKEAGALLISLLSSRLAPKYFWMTLFVDCLPLLELEEIVFNSEETNELMKCLHELYNIDGGDLKSLEPPWKKENADGADMETDSATVVQEKLNMIHLALSRNLGRALLYESCLTEI